MSLPIVVIYAETSELAFNVVERRRVEEYIPLKKRRQMEEERRDYLRRKLQVGDIRNSPLCVLRLEFKSRQEGGKGSDCHGAIQAPAQQLNLDEDAADPAHTIVDGSSAAAPSSNASQQPKESLLAAAAKARRTQPAETEQERALKEEQQIMADLQRKQALRSAMENAQVQLYLPAAGLTSAMRGSHQQCLGRSWQACRPCVPSTSYPVPCLTSNNHSPTHEGGMLLRASHHGVVALIMPMMEQALGSFASCEEHLAGLEWPPDWVHRAGHHILPQPEHGLEAAAQGAEAER